MAATYVENASGTLLERRELLRLLADAEPGDVLLLEALDRLSRPRQRRRESTKGGRGMSSYTRGLANAWPGGCLCGGRPGCWGGRPAPSTDVARQKRMFNSDARLQSRARYPSSEWI
ncbi:recombinase family protein [Pseudomonas sp. Snoq117.2]|uniref:recombinase family protein n=1 Tax=Pseudomonas sp. Snoq117.2 TaxID=1500302 RepID=UPI003531A61E